MVQSVHFKVRLLVAACVAVAAAGVMLPAQAQAQDPWKWSRASINYVRAERIVQEQVLNAGANKAVTRSAYVRALVKLERQRARRLGTPRLIPSATGAKLSDVGPNSVFAKAVALGWVTAKGDKFAGTDPITADEASRGIVGALGLRQSARRFAARLGRGIPGSRAIAYTRATHVYTRALQLRYNHPTGKEKNEVGPSEAMRLGHTAFMLHKAATAPSWRLTELATYKQFDLPALGANQKRMLLAGVRVVGQPYVWAGETEAMQPEGHGGFDCSGFIWRVLDRAGIPVADRYPLPERTSMAMSDIARSKRIKRGRLKPGDLMFWGYRGTRSKPSENFHAGVYMGNGWFIHSSGGNAGVTIDRVDGYWASNYSWGRRILRKY